MEMLTIKAYAKVNFSIDILGIRPDGYHEVAMIMQTIPLADVITITAEPRGPDSAGPEEESAIVIRTTSEALPEDARNLAYRAARAVLRSAPGFRDRLIIHIRKESPMGGGLGGGSADAAAVINGLNQLLSLGLSDGQLCEIAAGIGSDVPFLLHKGAAFAQGRGTELTPLPELNQGWLLLVNPGFSVSTAEVYRSFDTMEIPGEAHPDSRLLKEALRQKNVGAFCENMKNVLEYPAFALRPELAVLKKEIRSSGAAAACMSGSGATVFGWYSQIRTARKALKYFSGKGFYAVLLDLAGFAFA